MAVWVSWCRSSKRTCHLAREWKLRLELPEDHSKNPSQSGEAEETAHSSSEARWVDLGCSSH